jgi:hypothetical protein
LFKRGDPAEPDDPNSSGPDPNKHGKKEMGKENSPYLPHSCSILFCEKASLWPGGKSIARRKHRPIEFRISDLLGFLFQPAFRNPQSQIWENSLIDI